MKRLIFILCVFCVASVNATCLDSPLKGVNLAGAEFAAEKLPGVIGVDYAYPSKEDLAFFQSTGMTAIRLPIRWERIQHVLQGPLDRAEAARIRQILVWAGELNLCIVLDLHNYGTYSGQKLGSSMVTSTAFTDVWLRLVAMFPEAPSVAFGLMNEPAAIRSTYWLEVAQSTVLAMRRAGAQHLLLIASGRWSGAHEWYTRFDGVSAAEAFARFSDPLDRFAIELHQYVDADYSGTTLECIPPALLLSAMEGLRAWGKKHKTKFFMGEFGAAGTKACLADLRVLLASMEEPHVWLGWTYWAAGQRWGNYPFSIQPKPNEQAAQLTLMREFLVTP